MVHIVVIKGIRGSLDAKFLSEFLRDAFNSNKLWVIYFESGHVALNHNI